MTSTSVCVPVSTVVDVPVCVLPSTPPVAQTIGMLVVLVQTTANRGKNNGWGRIHLESPVLQATVLQVVLEKVLRVALMEVLRAVLMEVLRVRVQRLGEALLMVLQSR